MKSDEETIQALRYRIRELSERCEQERQRADRWMSRAHALDEQVRINEQRAREARLWERCHGGYMIR